jgi:hypothetical protein
LIKKGIRAKDGKKSGELILYDVIENEDGGCSLKLCRTDGQVDELDVDSCMSTGFIRWQLTFCGLATNSKPEQDTQNSLKQLYLLSMLSIFYEQLPPNRVAIFSQVQLYAPILNYLGPVTLSCSQHK